MTICFHHCDLDGYCAGAIVKKFEPDCKLVEINYNHDQLAHIEKVEKNEKVYIVDFTFQPDSAFNTLLEKTKNVIWIDHHKTNLDKFPDISGLRTTEKSGCVLTWLWFIKEKKASHCVPEAVALIGDIDNWTFEYGEKAELFYLGLGLNDIKPLSPIWTPLLSGSHAIDNKIIQETQTNGKIIKQYKTQSSSNMISAWAFEGTFDGHNCIFLNKGQAGIQSFDSVKDKYDLYVSFIHDGKGFTVSLYSTSIDVSVLAKNHGGGGHKGASGFYSTEFPWKLNPV